MSHADKVKELGIPWKVGRRGWMSDSNNGHLADLYCHEDFIIHAANSHHALVEELAEYDAVLQEAVSQLVVCQMNARIEMKHSNRFEGVPEAIQPTVDKARALLATHTQEEADCTVCGENDCDGGLEKMTKE